MKGAVTALSAFSVGLRRCVFGVLERIGGMGHSIPDVIREINENAKAFRISRSETFERYDLHTIVYGEKAPVVGIGKLQAGIKDAQRTTVLEVLCSERLEMLEMALRGASASPAEIAILRSVLATWLQELGAKRLIVFNEAVFKTLAARTTDAVRDEHWRTAALPVPIHHGDLIVLKSPTPNPQTGVRVQVVLACRPNPTAPLGAADISTGKLIANLTVQQGRAAKLTIASAQHIYSDILSKSDIRHLLQHQMARDREKAKKLSGKMV